MKFTKPLFGFAIASCLLVQPGIARADHWLNSPFPQIEGALAQISRNDNDLQREAHAWPRDSAGRPRFTDFDLDYEFEYRVDPVFFADYPECMASVYAADEGDILGSYKNPIKLFDLLSVPGSSSTHQFSHWHGKKMIYVAWSNVAAGRDCDKISDRANFQRQLHGSAYYDLTVAVRPVSEVLNTQLNEIESHIGLLDLMITRYTLADSIESYQSWNHGKLSALSSGISELMNSLTTTHADTRAKAQLSQLKQSVDSVLSGQPPTGTLDAMGETIALLKKIFRDKLLQEQAQFLVYWDYLESIKSFSSDSDSDKSDLTDMLNRSHDLMARFDSETHLTRQKPAKTCAWEDRKWANPVGLMFTASNTFSDLNLCRDTVQYGADPASLLIVDAAGGACALSADIISKSDKLQLVHQDKQPTSRLSCTCLEDGGGCFASASVSCDTTYREYVCKYGN
jgi:hypothetical protein